jgi:hypothetical protein
MCLTLTVLAASWVGAPPASAYDNAPCVYRGEWRYAPYFPGRKVRVYRCPLWRGNVPVYRQSWDTSGVVGHLNHGGYANWFYFHIRSTSTWLGAYANDHWAYTIADNGQPGWVPEVYFSGGNNWEGDAGLPWIYVDV